MASRFIDALVASPLPIIMEVKRSDAEGAELIGDRPIEQIVSEYVAAGAPCISVVTGRWFGGVEQMLIDVAGLTDLPLLQKDFITREKQVIRAKEIGASAVLLTARILPKSTFRHMIETTLPHELTPFVEIADHEELASVVHAEQCIVAINNKDIRTQERGAGDLDRSRSLLDAVIDSGTPVPASASAITDPEIAAELVSSGFKGLLIGTGLLQADSIQGWIDAFERHRSAQAARDSRRREHRGRDITRRALRGPCRAGARCAGDDLGWAGDKLRRAAEHGRGRLHRARSGEPAGRSADRDPGEEVARGDRADPGVLAVRPAVPIAVDRARRRHAGEAVRAGRRPHRALADRPPERQRRQPAGARRRAADRVDRRAWPSGPTGRRRAGPKA